MRCRKVRSFLSAFCNDELTGRKQLAVREHLSTCSECRDEEAVYRSMQTAAQELPQHTVSDDFNNRLLNRIAQERFAETRTQAYLPTDAPAFEWRRLVPAVASVAAALLLAFVWLSPFGADNAIQQSTSQDDQPWLTVSDENNPNLRKDWSLDRQLDWSSRTAKITNAMTGSSNFGDAHLTGSQIRSPYIQSYHRMQPVIKIYMSTQRSAPREEQRIF